MDRGAPESGFAGETAVLTTNGLLHIADLAGKSFVAIVDGDKIEAACTESECATQLLHISLCCGLEIRVSNNCMFFTTHGWRRAEELSVHNTLLLSEFSDSEGVPFHVDRTRETWGDALARHYTVKPKAGETSRRDTFSKIRSIVQTKDAHKVYACNIPGAIATSGIVARNAILCQ